MRKKVTEEEKKESRKAGLVYGSLSGLLVGVVVLGLSSMVTDKAATKEELKKKADIEYVDKRCLEVKSEIKSDQDLIQTNLRDLNRKTDKILELMITQKK